MKSGPSRQSRRQAAQIGKQRGELVVVEEINDMEWRRKMRWGVSGQEYRPWQGRTLRRTDARQPVCQQGAETVAEKHMRSSRVDRS